MSFFQELLESPPPTRLSRYTEWNGAFYLVFGVVTYVWPGVLQVLGAAPFQGSEQGLVRLTGFTLIVIGWFYVMGARTRANSFGLATVADRFVVPFFLLPLGLTGAVDPHIVVPFAIIDPLLAIGAIMIWRSKK